jgi:AcrR family transcriptional regulator
MKLKSFPMPDQSPGAPLRNTPKPGLRERKKLQTRERLTTAAMALFLEKGFEATTLDDIAEAAEMSRRSFFHYFASKEEVVFAWKDAFGDGLVAALAQRPQSESLMLAAERALIASISGYEREEAIALSRLVKETPALRAYDQVKYEKLERVLAAALAERAAQERMAQGGDPLPARLVAMVTIGALRVANDLWLDHAGAEPPADYARRIFADLRKVICD